MKTFKLFTFEDIDLKISLQFQIFVLMLSLFCFLGNLSNGLVVAFFSGIEILFYIFFAYSFVVVHEYGHALAAKHLGYKTENISLYPMAGIASISGDWHKNSWHEFIIVVWGPITNVVMGIAALCFLQLCKEENTIEYSIINFAVRMNFTLFVFNLIPVYPMDGGRIIRSVIGATLKDWWVATIWTTRVSFVCGLLAIPLGFYFEYAVAGLLIAFMGVMVAQGELALLKKTREEERLEKERLSLYISLIMREAENLFPNDKISQTEFLITMYDFREFIIRLISWTVKEEVTTQDFEKMIGHFFSELKNGTFVRSFDEEALFEEMRQAVNGH